MAILVTKGLRSVTISAVAFRDPIGPHGPEHDAVVTMWEARISNLIASKPDYVSRNKDPDAALAGAADLFAKQKDVVPSTRRKPVEPDLDDEAEALI